jgi:pyrroloquinoline quinone biosynthesis protein D
MRAAVVVNEEVVLRLARGVKLRFDRTREVWVLMAPEHVLMPDGVALDILKKLDGSRSVAEIIELLVQEYDAEREALATDTLEFLQSLADRSFVSS